MTSCPNRPMCTSPCKPEEVAPAIENKNREVGTKLIARYKKEEYRAEVVAGEEGRVKYRLADGREFKSLSSADTAITGKACNEWAFWSIDIVDAPGDWETRQPGRGSPEPEVAEPPFALRDSAVYPTRKGLGRKKPKH